MTEEKPRKRRKRSNKYWKECLDTQWSQLIRNRDKVCLKCKGRNNLHAAHIYSRAKHSVRWDLQNGVTLCYKCHYHWAHQYPIEFTEWIKERFSESEYEELRARARTTIQLNDITFLQIESYLNDEAIKL